MGSSKTIATMSAARRLGAVLTGLMMLLPLAAAAEVEGGGALGTDCWVTFDSVPAANYPVKRPTSIKCADQDSMCGDADSRIGYCGYSVTLNLNSSHFPPRCTPTDLSSDQFLIPYTEPANDDHPKHDDDWQPFQTFVENSGLSQATGSGMGQTDISSPASPVTVPLSISFTAKGPVFRATTLTMHTTLCPVGIKGETLCPTSPNDVDNFKLTCTPPIDPMTGKAMSACIGADGNPLSGTFQQIQEQIFDRKCSNISACHNPGPPNLCLRTACGMQAAYTDLYDHFVTNVAANADGLKRVDPGNAANSLIVHKVNGGTQLNSPTFGTGAYGLRMPYNNPTIGKIRPKLTHSEIQMITDWISAGAPMTGFVSNAVGACH